MEYKRNFSIREISRLLDIPKPTIRYWESKGLIEPGRNQENDYREFSLVSAMELSNISFYRSIGVPIKELEQMLHGDVEQQEQLLGEAGQRIEAEVAEKRKQLERIRKQRQVLQESVRLAEAPLVLSTPAFAKVVPFLLQNEAHWKRIIDFPDTFVLLFDSSGGYQYGIGYREEEQSEAVIWERQEKPYLEGLLITDDWNESKNNLCQMRAQAEQSGYRTGRVLAQYLTFGVKEKGRIWDYYKMWMEVVD